MSHHFDGNGLMEVEVCTISHRAVHSRSSSPHNSDTTLFIIIVATGISSMACTLELTLVFFFLVFFFFTTLHKIKSFKDGLHPPHEYMTKSIINSHSSCPRLDCFLRGP